MSDLEELARQLAGLRDELRDLTREGHGVVKDMTRLLAELRKVSADAADQAASAAHAAAVAEMNRVQDHIQAQLDASSRDLNRSIERARYQVVKALTITSLEGVPGRGLRATFAGNLFDDGSGP